MKIVIRFPKHSTTPSAVKYTYVAHTNKGNVTVTAEVPVRILDHHGSVPKEVFQLLRNVSNHARTILRIKYNIFAHYEFANSYDSKAVVA